MAVTKKEKTEIANWVSSKEFEPVIEQIIEYGSKIHYNTEDTVYIFIENEMLIAPFELDLRQELIDYAGQTILNQYRDVLYRKINERRKLYKMSFDF